MKKIFLTLVALIACVVYIYANSPDASSAPSAAPAKPKTDSNITGHAVDAVTGEHLAHVTISVKGTTIGTITDRTGHFFLKNLPLGEYVLVASYVGYENEEQEIVLKGGKTKEVNFSLNPATVHMNQIVVSASRNAENRAESPVIVNVLSAQLIDNTSSCTIADALDYQAGLRVEYNCSNCGFPQLRINGLEGQYSQILLDSRPLFSSLAGVYGLEQLPTGMVDRIEVIRGGGSAMYGSNAVAGVVNIITKEPVRNTLSISNMTSLMDGKSVDMNTVLNGSFVSDDYRTGVYIFGMIRDRDHYDRNGDGFSDLPKLNSETIGFRGYYKTSNYSKLTAEFHHIREFRRGGNKLKYPAHKSDITEQLRHQINGGGLNFDMFSKNYRHKANVYVDFQRIERNSYFGGGGSLDAYGLTNDDTFIVGGQYSYKMNKCLFMPAEITGGLEYTDNYLHDEMLGYGRDLKQTSRVIGGYIQNEWKNRKVSFAVGARLDKHNKIDDPVFSPRVNLRYTPIENIILRAGYSSGYRAPQAYDEELHVGAVGEGHVTMIKMAKNLKTEYSNSFTASVDLYKTWGKWQANLLLEGFYTKLDNAFALKDISREPVDPDDPDGPAIIWKERYNESGAKVWGINIEGNLSYSNKAYLQVGYTSQRSRYKDPYEALEDVEPVRRMLRAPNNYGFMALGYNPCKAAQIVVNGVYTGSMLVPHERPDAKDNSIVKTKDFWDMGFKLSYDFKLGGMVTLQFNAGIKNVFDQFQKDLDYGPEKDAGFIYGPSIPRTYFFGIKFMM